MPHFFPEPPTQNERTAVLLINLGTPDAPTPAAVKRYLAEFLSDQRVVELPRWLWQPLLRGLILPLRGGKSARLYQKIWLPEGSPLLYYTRQQAQGLAARLRHSHPGVVVAHAMSYGRPSVADTLADLKRQGVTRLLVLPLYPQYAASSTGAALDKVWRLLPRQRHSLAVRSIHHYADDAGYIAALADSVRAHWQQHGRGDKLLLSFHGIPQAHVDAGDPYVTHCHTTTRLLASALGLTDDQCLTAFQSQFGKAKWVGPGTQTLLAQLPQQGVRSLDVLCPGFAADCLESLEEIALQGREDFYAAGGQDFRYIPCLNSRPVWLDALADLVGRHLQGWPPITAANTAPQAADAPACR